ncbi:hypothetical protein BBK82_03210 [Lentzea guizhouensis]|uniref:Minor tail protein n=1 Tax=Lentzea guizhouensis TaxID=1586287 RepID=A0A1B2HC14_9PSEU|nr:hypothetical protein [Lentzea guizhouensis]ANZ35226.1 hypothetical protein BBK82_03210 [Lentzea guizhouensis]
MPLPAAVGTVTIAYDIRHPAGGAPGTGTVEVTIPFALRDSTDNVIIAPGVIRGTVTAGVGQVVIPDPNDPQISPQGWAPHIKVLTDVWAAEFDVVIPEGSGDTTIQLADLAPAEAPPTLVSYALAGHTHSGGGGGDVPDATTSTKGIIRLAGDFGGTANAPTVPALADKYVKPVGGIPQIDLAAAIQALLALAGTAVQPGALAAVATSGAYGDLAGRPSIPDSYDDLTGTVPTSALPAIAITEYLGAVASQAEMLTLAGQRGDWCTRTDLGTTWIITGDTPTQLASWTALSYPTAPVISVAGQTGAVTLGKADVGLGNVANLAPADLGISTATQTALDGKQAADTDLAAIAGLAPADGALLQRIGGAWAARTLAGLKSDLTLDQVANLAPADLPISNATQTALDGKVPLTLVDAAGDLLVGSGVDTLARLAKGTDGQVLTVSAGAVTWGAASSGDRELYQPSTVGLLEWTADPKDVETDFNHASGNLLMVRFRYRGSAASISEIGFAVTSAASGPGAYSGVALYEDGTGVVNRLGQSADAGASWTSPGVKSIALTAPVNVTPGNYYRAAILFVGSGAGKIAGCAATISDALLNHGVRRSVFLSGQTGFPSTLTISSMSTNNALYWLAMK